MVGKELRWHSQISGEPLQGLKQVWTVHEERVSGGMEDLGRGGEVLGVCPVSRPQPRLASTTAGRGPD